MGSAQTDLVSSLMALPVRGSGNGSTGHQTRHGVTNLLCNGIGLESRATEGNGPVRETYADSVPVSQVAPDPGKPA
jgi:hypothetical protein